MAAPGVKQFLFNRADGPGYRVVVQDSLGADGEQDGVLITVEPHGDHCPHALAELEKRQCLGWVAGEFAHELNNTLTSICGWLQILAQDLPPGNANRESLELVYEESKRTARMAASILSMARGEAGAPHRPLDLNALLNGVLVLVEPSVRKSDVELKRQLGELPAVCGSEDGLRQLFLNLLLNAAKATEKDGCITVSTEMLSSGQVCARVSDTGCGISPDALDRVFEAFYTTRSESGGTGLGLFVCRRIAKQHSGDLLVKSVLGEGSTFTVLLPPATGAEADLEAPRGGAKKNSNS